MTNPELTDVIRLRIQLNSRYDVHSDRHRLISFLLARAADESDSVGYLTEQGKVYFNEAREAML